MLVFYLFNLINVKYKILINRLGLRKHQLKSNHTGETMEQDAITLGVNKIIDSSNDESHL